MEFINLSNLSLMIIILVIMSFLMVITVIILVKQNNKRISKMILKKGDRVRCNNTVSVIGKVLEDHVDGKVKVEVYIPKHLIYKED